MEILKREGWDIWILSNSGLDDTMHLLDRMQLLHYVGDNLLCCDQLRLAKPHPKIYSELMRLAVHRTKRIEVREKEKGKSVLFRGYQPIFLFLELLFDLIVFMGNSKCEKHIT
jgi:hypothetical protein